MNNRSIYIFLYWFSLTIGWIFILFGILVNGNLFLLASCSFLVSLVCLLANELEYYKWLADDWRKLAEENLKWATYFQHRRKK